MISMTKCCPCITIFSKVNSLRAPSIYLYNIFFQICLWWMLITTHFLQDFKYKYKIFFHWNFWINCNTKDMSNALNHDRSVFDLNLKSTWCNWSLQWKKSAINFVNTNVVFACSIAWKAKINFFGILYPSSIGFLSTLLLEKSFRNH